MAISSDNEYSPGKRFLLCLPSGGDLIPSITKICREKRIVTAVFSVIGSVTSATVGVYDQKQQVFVTHLEKEATEILSCIGTVSQPNGSYRVKAKIILANQNGQVTGGHLFSKTIVSEAELDIQGLFRTQKEKMVRPQMLI